MRIKLKPRKKLAKEEIELQDELEEKNNKKKSKKKEPPKPWGKAERYLVLFILLTTTLGSGVLALSARRWKLPGMPQLNLPDFNFEQTYVIEADPTRDQDFEDLEADFVKLTNQLSGIYGFYVIRVYDNVAYGVNEDRVFQAASLIKLPVIANLYLEFDTGSFNPDTTYLLKDEDKIGGAGSLYLKPSGTKITYQSLASLMANQSDNTAFNISQKLLGDEKINNTIRIFGMTNTSLEKNKTTPKDIAVFYKHLYKDSIISISSRDQFLADLTNTSFEQHLVKGIPEDTKVSHKYGREVHVVNDAGFVFSDKPFILVLMSEGVVEPEADQIFPDLAKLIYEYELNHN